MASGRTVNAKRTRTRPLVMEQLLQRDETAWMVTVHIRLLQGYVERGLITKGQLRDIRATMNSTNESGK